jgi:hypothetical protein
MHHGRKTLVCSTPVAQASIHAAEARRKAEGGIPVWRKVLIATIFLLAGIPVIYDGSAARATGPALNLPVKLQGFLLTPNGTDVFNVTDQKHLITVSAPTTNQSSNTRAVFWPTSQLPAKNETVCDTWASAAQDSDQEGIVLRATTTLGIVVEKNIYQHGYSGFVIYEYAGSPATLQTLEGFDLSGTFDPNGQLVSLPWSMCARAKGRTISFIVWPSNQPQPAWGDPNYGGSYTLPTNDVWEGNYGWYAAHLVAGDSLTYADTVMNP